MNGINRTRLTQRFPRSGLVVLAAACLLPAAAFADSGFFVGGSVGKASLETDIGLFDFDDNDSAWKAFGGYIIDLPAIDFGFEGGYVDFGAPSSSGITVDTNALDLFATVGVDFGWVGLFGKVGLVSWDADVVSGGIAYSDDGTDSAYGLGLRFNISSLAVRIEYEGFDIEDADELEMISAGIVWRF